MILPSICNVYGHFFRPPLDFWTETRDPNAQWDSPQLFPFILFKFSHIIRPSYIACKICRISLLPALYIQVYIINLQDVLLLTPLGRASSKPYVSCSQCALALPCLSRSLSLNNLVYLWHSRFKAEIRFIIPISVIRAFDVTLQLTVRKVTQFGCFLMDWNCVNWKAGLEHNLCSPA